MERSVNKRTGKERGREKIKRYGSRKGAGKKEENNGHQNNNERPSRARRTYLWPKQNSNVLHAMFRQARCVGQRAHGEIQLRWVEVQRTFDTRCGTGNDHTSVTCRDMDRYLCYFCVGSQHWPTKSTGHSLLIIVIFKWPFHSDPSDKSIKLGQRSRQ